VGGNDLHWKPKATRLQLVATWSVEWNVKLLPFTTRVSSQAKVAASKTGHVALASLPLDLQALPESLVVLALLLP
jgi:hypothetical protein